MFVFYLLYTYFFPPFFTQKDKQDTFNASYLPYFVLIYFRYEKATTLYNVVCVCVCVCVCTRCMFSRIFILTFHSLFMTIYYIKKMRKSIVLNLLSHFVLHVYSRHAFTLLFIFPIHLLWLIIHQPLSYLL